MSKYVIVISALCMLLLGMEGYGIVNVAPITNETGNIFKTNIAPSTPIPTFQNWTAIAAPTNNSNRLIHATVYDPVEDKIYMIGGTPNIPLNNVSLCQQYDPLTNTWVDKTSMPTARGWINGAYVRGKIYVIGGVINSPPSAVAVNEEYNIATNSWTTKAPSPCYRCADMEVVWRDSLIYVMGGWTNMSGSSGYTNVDIYNPFTNAWSIGTDLPLPGCRGTATIIGDTIFIAQAWTGTYCWPNLYKGAIDPANPTQITWIAGPTLSQPVCHGGTAALDGNVYWLGGFLNATTVTNSCWKFNSLTGTISTDVAYPQTLARCCYMVARPSAHELYVIAGDADGDWNPPNNFYYKIQFAQLTSRDVGVDAIRSPGGSHPVGTVMAPKALVRNFGTAIQNNFTVVCSIVGAGGVIRYTDAKTITTGIAPDDTVRVNYTSWTPNIAEIETVKMQTNLPYDSNPANDRKVGITEVSAFLLSERFNGEVFPPVGWQANIIQGTYNWQGFTAGVNPTCSPYEGTAMVGYRSYSASSGSAARLISPVIMLSGAVPCTLKFWMYHDPGFATSPDSIRIETSTNGTTFTQVASFLRYAASAAWSEHTVELDSDSGTLYIAFQAYSGYGNNMYIDYVRLSGAGLGINEKAHINFISSALNVSNPNPITNGIAHISFTLAEPSQVSLKIYNTSGRLVKTLVNEFKSAGFYNVNWNCRDELGRRVTKGIYFYTLETPKQKFTNKLVLFDSE